MMTMKPLMYIIILTGLLLTGLHAHANTLNEAVKEARKQGQELSAKTRQGMHEIRVVTPQGSVKTIRKPVTQNNRVQQPETNYRQNYSQRQPSSQQPQKSDNRRDNPYSRQPEFRRFQRQNQSVMPSQSSRPSSRHQSTQRPSPQTRRQPAPSRSDDRNPD